MLNLGERIGKVKIGIPVEKLESQFIKIEKTDTCNVCMQEKTDFMESPCHHELCKECTYEWYKDNKKCAHCQTEIE